MKKILKENQNKEWAGAKLLAAAVNFEHLFGDFRPKTITLENFMIIYEEQPDSLIEQEEIDDQTEN